MEALKLIPLFLQAFAIVVDSIVFIHSEKTSYAYNSLLYIIAEKKEKNKSKMQNK